MIVSPSMLLIPALLAAGLDLSGRVVTPSGGPVVGAHVLVVSAGARTGFSPLGPSSHPDCRKRARSDADGQFRVDGVDPELIFRVLAIADGHRPEYATQVDPAKGPITIKLAPFDPARVPANRMIRGVVLDPDGRASVGARIKPSMFKTEAYYGFSPGVFEDEAITDLRGEFTLVSNSPIEYVDLKVRGHGFAPRAAPGLKPEGNPQRIVTNRGSTVTGRLVRDGKPVPGAPVGLVQADRSGGAFFGPTTIGTDAEGRFTFSNARANDNYFVYGMLSALPDAGAVVARPVRSGGEGATIEVGDLQVVRGHWIKGQAILSDGKPIPPKTYLYISREDAWDSRKVELNPEGRFDIAGLPTERYSVSVDLQGYRISPKNHSDDPQNSGRLLGTIDADILGLKILMEPGGR